MTPPTLAQLRVIAEKATPGEWQWFGNTKQHDVYLATVRGGRRLVMDFARWGMSAGQPRFQVAINGRGEEGFMRSISDMAKNEEVSKPDAPFGPLFEVPYRRDFIGIGHPDARHIAAFNPAQALALLDENERLRALLARRSAVLGVIECKRAGCLASIDLPIIANSAWHVDDEGRWICPAHAKELSHAD